MILHPLIFPNATGLTQNNYTILSDFVAKIKITSLTKSGNGSVYIYLL